MRPDGRPHLMPVIAFWIDGALHIVAGEGTRKARNLAADGRCVIAMSSTRLPSLDLVVEGRAEPLTDHDAVRGSHRVPQQSTWPLEAKGGQGLRAECANRGPAAVHDLPDCPVEGVRPPGHVRDGPVRPEGPSRNRRAGSSMAADPRQQVTGEPRSRLDRWSCPRSRGSQDPAANCPTDQGARLCLRAPGCRDTQRARGSTESGKAWFVSCGGGVANATSVRLASHSRISSSSRCQCIGDRVDRREVRPGPGRSPRRRATWRASRTRRRVRVRGWPGPSRLPASPAAESTRSRIQ